MAFTLRLSDEMVEKLDKLARSQGMNRTEYIVCLVEEAVERGFIPIRIGEGYRGVSPEGKIISLVKGNGLLLTGVDGTMNQAEQEAYDQAIRLAREGFWHPAKHALEKAGFQVINIAL